MKKKKKFNVRQKAVFKEIGGKECPRYSALTWKERDRVHAKLPAVKARHDRHMASME